MADIGTRQWTLTSADVSATPIFKGQVAVVQVEFFGYNAETDVCIIQDRNGKVKWQGDGASDKQTVRSGELGWIEGLILNRCDSGTVLIYIR